MRDLESIPSRRAYEVLGDWSQELLKSSPELTQRDIQLWLGDKVNWCQVNVMRSKIKSLVAIGLCAVISGCSNIPTEEELANGDYGSVQLPDVCVSIAEAKIKRHLKDPGSAIFSHEKCVRTYQGNAIILPLQFGYLQRGFVNARNSYGGYVGDRRYEVLINNGRVIRWCMASSTPELCPPQP